MRHFPRMEALPEEVLQQVLSCLTPEDLVTISRACRQLLSAAEDDSVWRVHALKVGAGPGDSLEGLSMKRRYRLFSRVASTPRPPPSPSKLLDRLDQEFAWEVTVRSAEDGSVIGTSDYDAEQHVQTWCEPGFVLRGNFDGLRMPPRNWGANDGIISVFDEDPITWRPVGEVTVTLTVVRLSDGRWGQFAKLDLDFDELCEGCTRHPFFPDWEHEREPQLNSVTCWGASSLPQAAAWRTPECLGSKTIPTWSVSFDVSGFGRESGADVEGGAGVALTDPTSWSLRSLFMTFWWDSDGASGDDELDTPLTVGDMWHLLRSPDAIDWA